MISKMKKNNKGFTLMEMLIVVAIIAILIAIAIPTFTSSLNKARVATDEANIRSGYASAMADLLVGDTTINDGTTLYLQKDGSVGATSDNNYVCVGTPSDNVEIAGQSVNKWAKGNVVTYTYSSNTNTFTIATTAPTTGN